MDFRNLQQEVNEGEGQQEPAPRKSTISLSGVFNQSSLETVQQEQISSRIPLTEIRKKLTEIVETIYIREEQKAFHNGMAVERKLPPEAFYKAKSFYVPDETYFKEIFRDIYHIPEYGLTTNFGQPIYTGRYIYPVLGFNSEVLGLIGYDKYDTIKYLLSRTVGFGQKRMFYGMQNIRQIYKKGYILVVEGIVDVILLTMLGQPIIGLNGNVLSDFVLRILRRFGHNVLFMPDNNETGERALTFWTSKVPEASVLRVTSGNDFDQWRMDNPFQKYQEVMSQILQNFQLGIRREYEI